MKISNRFMPISPILVVVLCLFQSEATPNNQCNGGIDSAVGIQEVSTYNEYVQAQSDLWDTIGLSGPYREETPASNEGLSVPDLFSCTVYCSDEIGCGSVSLFEDITEAQLNFILDAPFRSENPAPYGIAGGGDETAVDGEGFSRDISPGCLGNEYLLERLVRTEFNLFSFAGIDLNRKLLLVEGIKTLKKGGENSPATSFDTAQCYVQIQPSIDDSSVSSKIDEGIGEELEDFEVYSNRNPHPCAWGFFCLRGWAWCLKCEDTGDLSFDEWKNLDERFQQEKVLIPRVTAATNKFPAGDRVCVWSEDGKTKARVEHMSDTEINGLIGEIQGGVLGTLFTPQTVEAYASECRSLGSATLAN